MTKSQKKYIFGSFCSLLFMGCSGQPRSNQDATTANLWVQQVIQRDSLYLKEAKLDAPSRKWPDQAGLVTLNEGENIKEQIATAEKAALNGSAQAIAMLAYYYQTKGRNSDWIRMEKLRVKQGGLGLLARYYALLRTHQPRSADIPAIASVIGQLYLSESPELKAKAAVFFLWLADAGEKKLGANECEKAAADLLADLRRCDQSKLVHAVEAQLGQIHGQGRIKRKSRK